MSDAAQSALEEVVCPHCGKPFHSELLASDNGRRQGFKCPHCRLFVPLDRVAPDDDSAE